MKFLPYLLKHLRHNWIRTSSTVMAMSLCIFLWCTLETFVAAVRWNLQSANDKRLIVRHRVSLVFPMPITHRDKIASITGVKAVAATNWFGGVYQNEPKNFFPNFAIEAESYLPMYPEYIISEDEKKAFLEDMRGCVIGPGLAENENFKFKIGQTFQLESMIPTYQKAEPFEFVVRAIFKTDDVKYPGTFTSIMFFHRKYLYEGSGQKAGVGTFNVEIADPSRAAAVASEIDDRFENSDAETRTETEAAFRASFVSLAGNLAFLLESIGLAVSFTILLVTANTMSMSVRERRTEIGVLKTLGFSSRLVLALILGEATILGCLGGGLGILLASGLITVLPHVPGIGEFVRGFPTLSLSPVIALAGFAVAVVIGLASGIVPAITAYRSRITDMLRQV